MSFSLVQEDADQAATIFLAGTGAGNTLIVCVDEVDATIVDTDGNTWNEIVSLAAGRDCAVWMATDINGGDITISNTGTAHAHISASEWSSGADAETADTATDSQATGTDHPCGEVTGTSANSLYIAASRGASAFTRIVNGDYTQLSLTNRFLVQYRIAGAVTSTANWTSGDNEDVTSCHAAFKEAVVAGPITGRHYPRGVMRGEMRGAA